MSFTGSPEPLLRFAILVRIRGQLATFDTLHARLVAGGGVLSFAAWSQTSSLALPSLFPIVLTLPLLASLRLPPASPLFARNLL